MSYNVTVSHVVMRHNEALLQKIGIRGFRRVLIVMNSKARVQVYSSFFSVQLGPQRISGKQLVICLVVNLL